MPEQGLSERSIEDWHAFVQALGGDVSAPVAQAYLNQFLIGVHRRGEELYAHEIKSLLDESDVQPDTARDLLAFVCPALNLLAEYDADLRE